MKCMVKILHGAFLRSFLWIVIILTHLTRCRNSRKLLSILCLEGLALPWLVLLVETPTMLRYGQQVISDLGIIEQILKVPQG